MFFNFPPVCNFGSLSILDLALSRVKGLIPASMSLLVAEWAHKQTTTSPWKAHGKYVVQEAMWQACSESGSKKTSENNKMQQHEKSSQLSHSGIACFNYTMITNSFNIIYGFLKTNGMEDILFQEHFRWGCAMPPNLPRHS